MEETKTELQLIKLSEIQSQEVSWLWFPFIPYGKLTIVQVLSCKLDAPAPCRLDAPDFDVARWGSADCLHQHQQVI